MASMGADSKSLGGNQIFATVVKGNVPSTVDVRVQYEETVLTLKEKVAAKLGAAVEQLQLFYHGKELRSDLYDSKTLLKMDMHTGFAVKGYDLSVEPAYFPPVFLTPEGLREKQPIYNPEFLQRHPEAINDPETLVIKPGEPITQDPKWLKEVKVPANREQYAGM